MSYTLAIGDRCYSSWSLRAWLIFAHFDIPVTVAFARLNDPAFADILAGFAPARTVPAVRIDGGRAPIVLWDSLAIAETLAERFPDKPLWPGDPASRGLARAMTAEMHAGFTALRQACPMDLRHAYTGFEPPEAVRADIARIEVLWAAARSRAGEGPWLFGAYGIADAFFAPVATRIATYDLPVGPEAAAYVAAHLADPAFVAWREEGLADPVVIAGGDKELTERAWPGPAPA